MLSSALNAICLVVLTSGVHGSGAQSAAKDRAAWRKVEPSIVSILEDNREVGKAALVDSKGLFLTHLGAVYAQRVKARLYDGTVVDMTLKASDEPTQLAVLQADTWIQWASPLSPVDGGLKAGDKLLALLSTGVPIRAQFVNGKRYGVVSPSQRLVQLSEISFEAPSDQIGGALVITPGGKLVGFLNAALRSQQEVEPMRVQPAQIEAAGADNAIRSAAKGFAHSPKRFGPADMTVAYTAGLVAFQNAVDSLVRGKNVDRPSIGVDVKNAPGGGALVEKVEPGSGAAEAGIRQGDIVIEIEGKTIGDQVDLAKAVMQQPVGSSLRVKVKRGRSVVSLPVRVGSRSGKRVADPEGAI